ncbi:replication factor-A protein 1 [Cantharellus anzutake]|uniref:replication factor-A protein 1 n=1 Tax=Cantharellus anzutake TaxID=1750568 RepID=UPI0019073B56|nr:replication factor-A protein 1 [Cantharellus anzutake]KAF8330072.1 replication factor-A protein 1 [Cantharellus anzutake]
MTNPPELTSGAVVELMRSDGDSSPNFQPRLQLLGFKPLGAQNADPSAPDRYRLMVSDGEHLCQAMLNTKLNYLLEQKILEKNFVFTLVQYVNNVVQNKRLLIVLKINETDVHRFGERIGSPTALDPKPDANILAAASAATAGSRSPAPSSSTTAPVETYASRNPPAEKPPATFPIEGLSPYQNKWTIKARVTSKSEIRLWSNNRGDGKLFSCTFMDETGEIRATGFNAAVDEHYEKLQEGKVYYVSRARVNIAKKKYGSSTNEYEITLERTSEIKECMDTADLPEVKYSFVELSQMESQQKDALVDVLGVVHEVFPLGEIYSNKTNKSVAKRELTLVDNSGYSIRMTLWGKQAESFDNHSNPVIAFKGVRVGDFGGRSLGMFSGSSMQIDPDSPQAHLLRGWYDSGGKAETFQPQTPGGGSGPSGMSSGGFNHKELYPIAIAQEKFPGLRDTPDYFSLHATIVLFREENLYYTSCPGPKCQKKVLEQDDGTWRCEKCAKSYENCEYRYLLSVSVADHTGQVFLQGFNEVAEQLLGISAKDYHNLMHQDSDAAKAKLTEAKGKVWNLSCRVKQETYNGVTRPRYGINQAFAPDYAKDGLHLLELVRKYPPSEGA